MLERLCLMTAMLATAIAGVPALAGQTSNRPDILIILPDQMRGDSLSIVGHPAVRTPNLDELARQGALFRRGYATVPSCIPARYAMLTGLYPQTSGVVGYKGTRVTRRTMPQIFHDAGYLTALVGRTMHQLNTDEELGYEQVILGSVQARPSDHYAQFLMEELPSDTPLGKILHEEGLRAMVQAMGLTYNHWQAEPWPLDDDWHPTTWIARHAQQLLEWAAADRPLFLTASFYAPHPPLFPGRRFFDAYMERDLPQPAKGDWVDWDQLSPATWPPPQDSHGGSRVRLEGETLHRAQAGYFGLIEHLDDAVGPLIAAFKARSERAGRPWVILVTSEHGEMLGDHGYFRKCEPYEGSANIPFILAGSEDFGIQPGLRSCQPVCLEDVMPTLGELAGVTTPDVDGVSLVPLMRGIQQTVRPWLHLEHGPTYSDHQAFHALTDGRYKYIWRPHDGSEQLFDLDNDSREQRNLAQSAHHQQLLQQWRQLLIERLETRPEGFSDGEQLISGRAYRPHMPGKTP